MQLSHLIKYSRKTHAKLKIVVQIRSYISYKNPVKKISLSYSFNLVGALGALGFRLESYRPDSLNPIGRQVS